MASSFVDKVTITVRSGDGGNGAVTFHREKYVAAGGPDGGDGGRGGDIIFEVDDNMSTLMDFRYKRKYVAGNGQPGQGKRCSGKVGETLRIRVPRGTVLRDADSAEELRRMGVQREDVHLTADPALLLEGPAPEKAAAILTEEMQGAASLAVPLTAEAHYARNWYDAK